MTFASHIFWKSRGVRRVLVAVAWLALLLCGVMIVLIWQSWAAPTTPVDAEQEPPEWPAVPHSPEPDFSVFEGGVVDAENADGAHFLQDFRYAGSFFVHGDGTAILRRGVLSYLPENRQDIVSEGTVIAGVRVSTIAEDHIILEKDGVAGTLTLGGENSMMRSYLEESFQTESESGSKKTRFGEQTGDGVWTLKKEALQDYYAELLQSPERLLQVFDSMAPLYGDDGSSIQGYQLQTVGEKAFFDAVGFREGDVVRKVNALPMTNRGRAEFFIKQVIKDKMSAIVIDIERDGTAKRLVYQLR